MYSIVEEVSHFNSSQVGINFTKSTVNNTCIVTNRTGV